MVCSALVQFAASAVNAEPSTSWSFAAHPAPEIAELSEGEARILYPRDRLEGDDLCGRFLDRYKAVYASRYPAAPPFKAGTALEHEFLRKAVRMHANKQGSQGFACVLKERLVHEAARFHADTGRSICSLRMGGLDEHPQLEDYLTIVREGVLTDDPYHVLYAGLATMSVYSPHIDFNRDLRAYLAWRYDAVGIAKSTGPPYDPELSPERTAFVRDATRRADLEAVLDTTTPCR